MKLVIDVKQRRPACVLLQAALGGDMGIVNRLPAESWLVAPTDDMRMVEGTPEEWAKFGEELKKRFSTRCATAPQGDAHEKGNG